MTEQQPSRLQRFFGELRRRHVVRVLVGYAAVVFVVLQLSEIVLPAFLVSSQSDATIRVLVIAALLALPVVLALAWIYEITPQGIRSMRDLDAEAGIAEAGRFLPRVMLLVITVGAGLGGWAFAQDLEFDSGALAERDTFQAASTTDASSPIASLAVLPLEDQSASPDDAYFASSMHEAITSAVSQVSALRVISRTSVLRYDQEGKSLAQIGAELNVDAIIEGSVVVVEDQVRITVQLIHTASDTHLWAENYTRDFVDVLSLQQEVATEIADEIRARVEARTPGNEVRIAASDETVSDPATPPATPAPGATPGVGARTEVDMMTVGVPQAVQQDYLRGRSLLTGGAPEQVERARGFFEGALEEEPGFVPALTGLAGAQLYQALDTEGEERLGELIESRQLAMRALESDPDNVEAQEVLRSAEEAIAVATQALQLGALLPTGAEGRVIRIESLDTAVSLVGMEGAVIRFEGGDSILVDGGMAPVVTTLGEMLQRRFGESGVAYNRPPRGGADTEDPTERALRAALRQVNSGELGDAEETLEDAIDAGTRDWRVFELLELLYRIEADFTDVLELRQVRENALPGEPGPSAADLERRMEDVGAAGYWSWKQAEYAERTARDLPIYFAVQGSVFASFGQSEQAIQSLAAAAERREPALVTLRLDPVWDDLRGEPEFVSLVQRLRVDLARRGGAQRPSGG